MPKTPISYHFMLILTRYPIKKKKPSISRSAAMSSDMVLPYFKGIFTV